MVLLKVEGLNGMVESMKEQIKAERLKAVNSLQKAIDHLESAKTPTWLMMVIICASAALALVIIAVRSVFMLIFSAARSVAAVIFEGLFITYLFFDTMIILFWTVKRSLQVLERRLK